MGEEDLVMEELTGAIKHLKKAIDHINTSYF